jgi:autotransporter-associated beta strand protein
MNTPCLSQKLFAALVAAAGASLLPFASHAASATWNGTTDAVWATDTNWSATPAPGTGDTATFNNAGGSDDVINLGAGVTIGTVIFDTASATAYTIGSGGAGAQTLTLNDTGAVTVNATVATNQLFNANIILGTAIAGTTTITNGSTTNSLTFAGAISGGTGGTAGAKTINIGTSGVAQGAVNFTGSFAAGGSTGINLVNAGTGTVTLSGSGTSNLLTLRATGNSVNSKIVVDGQTVNVTNSSTYTATSGFDILSGAVNFNGGISQTSTSADSGLWKVTGGAFSAASVTIARNGNPTASAAVTSSSGLVVTGGTANITGIFSLGTNNSGSTSLVNGGALTVGGELRITAGTSTNRYNILEVRSGSLTSTDATNGIVLSRAGTFAQNAQLLLTGGTTTAEKITFGTASTFAGSTGDVILNGGSASLYLGSGGMVSGGGANITNTIRLTSGTLGAKADWSSSLAMNLNGLANGSAVTIKAADVSNVARNISLSGILSGAGGFTKTGGGTLTLSGANTYTGDTLVNAGSLVASHASAIGGGSLSIGGGAFSSSVGDITLAANKNFSLSTGTWSVSITNTSTFDQIFGSGTGTFSITGGSIALSGISDYSTTYTLLSGFNSGTVGGLSITGYDTTNWIASLSNAGVLSFTVSSVPEPSTYAGLATLGFVALRRRRA